MINELKALLHQYKDCKTSFYADGLFKEIDKLISKREKEMREKAFKAARLEKGDFLSELVHCAFEDYEYLEGHYL